jgi:hypothetical protein
MNEFLTKFGFTEIIEYLLPGVIALCSILPWGRPDPSSIFGNAIGQSQFVLAALVLVFAYACGLALSILGLSAQSVSRPISGGTWGQMMASTALSLKWALAQQVAPPSGPSIIRAYSDIGALLERICGGPLSLDGVTQISLFRALAVTRLGDKAGSLIAEAETHRRRFMFSMGVALALLVLAGFAILRLAVHGLVEVQLSEGVAPWRLVMITGSLVMLAASALWAAALIKRSSRPDALALAAVAVASVATLTLTWRLLANRIQIAEAATAAEAVLTAVSLAVCLRLGSNVALAKILLRLSLSAIVLMICSGIAVASFDADDASTTNFSFGIIHGLADWEGTHSTSPWLLVLLTLGAILISRALRKVAGRCLEGEIAPTLALARIYGNYF